MDKYVHIEQLKDYLNRQIQAFEPCPDKYDAAVSIYYGLHRIPAADVVPVRHGHWIWDPDGMDWGIGAWRCSECRARSPMWWNTDKTNPYTKSGHRYCPNCGAKMDDNKNKK